VNLCSRNSPYGLNCLVGTMLVFRMLCRITQSLRRAQNWVSVTDWSLVSDWSAFLESSYAAHDRTNVVVFCLLSHYRF